MYLDFYHLKQTPFHITPDPAFLFRSPSHQKALASITYGIEERQGFVLIAGEVGVGKTTILRAYLDQVDPARLTTDGTGESDPKASNADLEGRAINRRVELTRTDR